MRANNTLQLLEAELKRIANNNGPDAALRKVELIYRIGVLQCFNILLRSAPAGSEDTGEIIKHFRILDSFIQSLLSERRYHLKYDEKQLKNQETARLNFERIFKSVRGRFKRFKKTDHYPSMAKEFVLEVYVVWYQYRQTFVEINLVEE